MKTNIPLKIKNILWRFEAQKTIKITESQVPILNSEAASQRSSWEKVSENMQQIYSRTPMPKCDFNKVAKQLYWNHTST